MSFLTILPAPRAVWSSSEMGRAAVWFPLVGGLLGALLVGVAGLADWRFSALLTSGLVVVFWAVLTGGLHLDGVADCCDGLLPPLDRARRLDIMRDPRVGAFGAVGLILFLLLKVGLVAELINGGLQTGWSALLLAPLWARWWLLWIARQPAARAGGMGAAFGAALTTGLVARAGGLSLLVTLGVVWAQMVISTGVPSPAVNDLLAETGIVLAGVVGCGVVVAGIARLARQRLGGVTGDVFGLAVEAAELAYLLTWLALRPL